jgi:flap endonuclease-1
MGVGDLGLIMEKKELAFSEVRGKIAVDAFNTLYQFLTIIRQKDGTPLMDSKGRITSHLSGLFYRTCNMLEKGIKPVYVFDGKPSEFKKKTILERSAAKEEAEEELRKARKEGREEDVRKYAQRTARLTDEQINDSKKILDLIGVPWIQANGEGEAQCAFMCKSGVVAAAASQDFDTLLFGAPKLIRNLTVAGRRKLPGKNVFVEVLPEEFDLNENLARLGINQQKLVWIAVLVGTDFNEGIFGIGPKKALKLVQQHDDFEKALAAAGKEMPGWKEIEEIFLKPDVFEVKPAEIELKNPDQKELIEFMCGEHDFSRERVQSSLARAFKEPLDSEQASLKKWF